MDYHFYFIFSNNRKLKHDLFINNCFQVAVESFDSELCTTIVDLTGIRLVNQPTQYDPMI